MPHAHALTLSNKISEFRMHTWQLIQLQLREQAKQHRLDIFVVVYS
jgi:hypothetical protein